MSILLASATEAEIGPTLEWLREQGPESLPNGSIRVCITGVGLMAASYNLTRELCRQSADLVVGAGIAGAFNREISLGECVVVRSEQIADFGAEDGDEYLSVFDMGLVQANELPFNGGKLMHAPGAVPPSMARLRQVDSLTVMKVSGKEATIEERIARYGADIEGMEGAALHFVCGHLGIPFVQLRAISNYVTRRDRSTWEIGTAISALNKELQDWLKRLG